jgi:hypothetical protein
VSNPSSVEVVLRQAREREKEYEWFCAVEFYKKALGLVSEQDFSKLAEINECLAYAFYRAAMQAASLEEFKERMRQSASNYEKVKEFYGRLNEPAKTPRLLRCDAMVAYVGYWLATEVPEKKRLVNECWRLAKVSLKSFEQAADALEYGKTYNQLVTCVVFGFALEWDFQTREKMIKEALELGGQAIRFLLTLGDLNELARAYAKTAVFQDAFIQYFLELDEQEKTREKALSAWQKAVEISEEIAFIELLSSTVQVDHENIGWETGVDDLLRNFNKALQYANRTRDKFVIGRALDWLTYHTSWKLMTTENQDSAVELVNRTLQYAQEAKNHYSRVSFISARDDSVWIESPHCGVYLGLAMVETNLKKRRERQEKALETAPDTLKKAEDSGYPEIIRYAHQIFSTSLTGSAAMETNSDEKKRLLEKALMHGKEASQLTEQLEPFDYWDRGIFGFWLATARCDLAELTKDYEAKKNMLAEAALNAEDSLKLCARHATYLERRGFGFVYAVLGSSQYQLGRILDQLFESTYDKNRLGRAAEVFAEAAESYRNLGMTSRMAECCWKAAQIYDKLGDHLRAAENFDAASNNYGAAAEKIPQLKEFYQDHAIYMEAWSEIEKARHHHLRQEYGSAEEHFSKAASLHKSLKQWSYLASNYFAWTQVEHAEELSRKEQSEEAIQGFQRAIKLFEETRKSLQTELGKIEDLDEKQMANNMVKATDLRQEYCTGRIALEEAKTLDKKGEHYSSSEKYDSAGKIFEKITSALETDQERKEFRLITALSQAWAKMTQAEAEESPNLYAEAAQLFEQAKEFCPNEKARMLTQGHSRFCKALEAGTKFADTKDQTLHAVFMQNLENASNYYVKAGLRNASEYAKATKLLFDAYVQMDNAQKENDPEKKAKLYTLAEKILQTSAGSFMQAEHPEKREQVLRLLDKVKDERELALSLNEVLHAPTIVSTTTVFNTPTPTQENSVGLERFEHADIQANIITRQKELRIGENLDLEIELVNAGKGPALLTKITEIIPEGFEVTEKPETYRVEDSYINMKGKRLDPLKMEEVKLILKPKVQGEFPIKPRILYLDENGKYKSHEPEPVTITVKELGIKGWLKGEK